MTEQYDVDAVVNNEEYLDSREVAKMVDKRHDNLVRDIGGYLDDISQNSKLSSDSFFIKSSYKSGTGKQYTCYLVTKIGCQFIANKLQGKKGNQFTAQYVTKFDSMEKHIQEEQAKPQLTIDADSLGLMYEMAQEFKGTDNYQYMLADTMSLVTGQKYLVQSQHDEYSAGDIAKKLGITANRVGRDANALGLKATEPEQNEYGYWVHYSKQGHEGNRWVYFKPAIEKIKQYEIERLETA